MKSVRANQVERTRWLPGDDVIGEPIASMTHAITIRRSPREVWPWLAQMGAGTRAGWYSYDRLDNGGRPSAERIVQALQQIHVGTLFPALPGATDGFVAVNLEPERFLVLGWPNPEGRNLVTWAFVLESAAQNSTRLITRASAAPGYPYYGLPAWLGRPVIRLVHFIMQRRQLLGIARRVEQRTTQEGEP